MTDYINQFIKTRECFLEALKRFPKERVEEKLFGQWNLKDVIAHFLGWDIYFTQSLKLLKLEKEIPHWGKINDFNEKSVKLRKTDDWKKIYGEFEKAGQDFIDEYKNTPKELQNKLFWPNKKYTPLKFLKINIDHYEKAQLQDIKKLLKKWGI